MFLIWSLLLFFVSFFLLGYLFMRMQKPQSKETKKKTLIAQIKDAFSIHKKFLKISSINVKMNSLWVSMGKPSYPLPEDIIIIKL